MSGRRRAPAGGRSADRGGPGLDPRQRELIRRLSRETLARHGVQAVVRPDHLATADGRVFGLMNVESVCRNHGEDRWPDVLEAHFNAILKAFPGTPPPLMPEQLRAGVHARLVLAGAEDLSSGYSYARRLGPDLTGLLAHVQGPMVRWLTDAEVDLVGADELWPLGLDRVDQVRPQECERIDTDAGHLWCLRGESGFVASKLLVLEQTVGLVTGAAVGPGEQILVGVPTRYELAFIRVTGSARQAESDLSRFTAQEFDDGVGPLSPYAYRWREGRCERIAQASWVRG